MGNVDSKEGDKENDGMVVADVGSKYSKGSTYSDVEPYDNNENAADSPTGNPVAIEEIRENDRNSSSTGSNNTRDDEVRASADQTLTRIQDDQVHVNMAMADLMAYLQVVANNSNNLPLTRRDDPELDRTVSNLSSEDYARKSAAFIPADVRFIGGAFTRYGRVWDLPTSEEYNASDGAQEPGRSYGGACCNTFLKVLYDAASDSTAPTEFNTKSLFEDDDEDEDESSMTGKSFRSMYSIDYSALNQTVTTWGRLVGQMKAEFKEIGYSQYPKITTTRKMDLGKLFSFQPDNFDIKVNKRRSLLIGCNYINSLGAELKASHDDIRSIKDYIVNVHGFSEAPEDMLILLDEDGFLAPTFMNIIEAFKRLSEESMPGDAVFVQFSGHGGRVLDAAVDSEAQSYDEVIVPSDYKQSGLIRDTLIFKTLLAPMRFGVTLTIMIDCCDTGMVLELPYSWNSKSAKDGVKAKLSANDDFSFVRFLKVVKTLYESSTFTQLGKTVGSALNNPLSHKEEMSPEQEVQNRKKSKSKKKGSSSKAQYVSPTSDSILEAITDACSSSKNDVVESNTKGVANDNANSTQQKDNFFEQMIRGCSLLATPEDDFSDEETFKTRTYDDQSFYSEADRSFETNTEDEYDTHSRQRRH